MTHPRIKVVQTHYRSRKAGHPTPSPAPLRTPVSRSSGRTCSLPAPISPSTTRSCSEDPHLSAPPRLCLLFFFGCHAGAPGLPARPGARGPVPETMRALPGRRRASERREVTRSSWGPGPGWRSTWTSEGEMRPPGHEFKLQTQGGWICRRCKSSHVGKLLF